MIKGDFETVNLRLCLVKWILRRMKKKIKKKRRENEGGNFFEGV